MQINFHINKNFQIQTIRHDHPYKIFVFAGLSTKKGQNALARSY
jgi:hypothetical protein